MVKVKEDRKNASIEGAFSPADLGNLGKLGDIEKLSITKLAHLTVKMAEGFAALSSVKELFIWCSVNRTAMRHVIDIPGLEVLDVLKINNPGRLAKFSQAKSLKIFRCNLYMSEADLREVSNIPKLQVVGAQNSEITTRALKLLLRLPYLTTIDLEATKFTDKLAEVMASSKTIKHLSLGATKLTSKGLKSISTMSQLESLDIWAIDVDECDLAPIANLQNLRYLSVGGYEEQTRLTLRGVMPYIEELPALTSLWLDGIPMSDAEIASLTGRYEYFRN